MFLGKLSNNQKDAFITLAYRVIEADGVLDEKELEMIDQYKLEMNLPPDYEIRKGAIEQAINIFMPESETIKKQIMFELVALACVDNEFKSEEYQLIERIQSSFGLDENFLKTSESYVISTLELYDKIKKLVGM